MFIFGFCLRFVDWYLEFIWNLGFDNWNFFDLPFVRILRLTAMHHRGDFKFLTVCKAHGLIKNNQMEPVAW